MGAPLAMSKLYRMDRIFVKSVNRIVQHAPMMNANIVLMGISGLKVTACKNVHLECLKIILHKLVKGVIWAAWNAHQEETVWSAITKQQNTKI